MKSCSYCGKEYAENITICPLDGHPVIESKNDAIPASLNPSFDVRLISPISAAGTYRVFIERSDLLFIQVESGAKSVLNAIAPLLGPAGGLIPLVLWLFNKSKANDRLQKIEQQNPEDLLHDDENNFKLYLAEIREAAIKPPSFISTSGKAGRLNLLVRHGENLKFEFKNEIEMKKAIALLMPILGATLKINVEWNESKQRFEKKKAN